MHAWCRNLFIYFDNILMITVKSVYWNPMLWEFQLYRSNRTSVMMDWWWKNLVSWPEFLIIHEHNLISSTDSSPRPYQLRKRRVKFCRRVPYYNITQLPSEVLLQFFKCLSLKDLLAVKQVFANYECCYINFSKLVNFEIDTRKIAIKATQQ